MPLVWPAQTEPNVMVSLLSYVCFLHSWCWGRRMKHRFADSNAPKEPSAWRLCDSRITKCQIFGLSLNWVCLLETDRQLKKVLWAHSFAFRVDHPIFTKISRSMKGVFWGTFLSRHLPISGILNRATISSRYGISCSSANQRPCALRTMLVGEGRVVRNALSLILLSGWIERLYLFTKARSSIFLKLGGDKQGADGSFRQ